MPGYTPRPYTPSDHARCLGLFDSNVPKYFTDDERHEFQAFLHAMPGPYLVIEDEGGHVVACGGHARTEEKSRVDLCWGMVSGDLHSGGIGTFLTRTRVEAAFTDPAVRHITLNTSQHTVGFYEAMGFELESVEPDGYATGLDRCEMRLARREISQ